MNDSDAPRLCFLGNDRLQAPLVAPLDVRNSEGVKIGKFDGVIVDPAQRRVRYLVVDKGRWFHRRCLIPLTATQVDAEHNALRVDVDAADSPEWAHFNPSAFPPFSDDDLITAMFSRQA